MKEKSSRGLTRIYADKNVKKSNDFEKKHPSIKLRVSSV